ncbi:MAG TPA: MCP four helix bundle domain-containing protein, partial [Duganella sp.]|nr:MCP four helix bundle domain-containing protein [Duganella sp.]
MKWFYDLKIATKLIASFAVVLLLTLVLGVAAISSTERVNEASNELADNWMPSVRAVLELRGDLGDMRRWELSHLVSDDAAEYAIYDAHIASALAAMKAHRATYDKLISSAAEKAIAVEFDRVWSAFMADHANIIRMSAAGQKAEARTLLKGSSATNLGQLNELVNKLVKINIDGGDAASAAATATYENARLTSILLLVINIAIGIALALWVARVVSAPLRQAVSVATA